MKTTSKMVTVVAWAAMGLATNGWTQGDLVPPGAPGPTMKTLDQVEPRTPILSVPFTISRPGSYYLTTNLTAASGENGITVEADDVTIDLMGFTLRGSGGDSGHGIWQTGGFRNLRVHGGKVVAWGQGGTAMVGIFASGANNVVEDIQAFANASAIAVGDAGVVRRCSASSNFVGIAATGNRCSIKDNLCVGNGRGLSGAGIRVEQSENRIESNQLQDGDRGLWIQGTGNYVADNIVMGNADNYELVAGNQLNLLIGQIPETLDWPCSVKLAGTLTCAQTGVDGLTVNADDVTIDLGGHALIGPGADSGSGIKQDVTFCNLRVHNGKVANWLGTGTGGIQGIGANGQFRHVQAMSNHYGIVTGGSAIMGDCSAMNNTVGISVGGASVVADCTANRNSLDGITAGSYVSISGCMANGNRRDGIRVDDGCTVMNSACGDNSRAGSGSGIRVTSSSEGSRIDSNNVYNNGVGITVEYSGNLIVRNNAQRNLMDYNIAPGNNAGTVTNSPVGAGPWDNISY